MKRELGDGYELDDDPARIDRDAVHVFLSRHAYWATGRARAVQEALIDASQRVVGLYHEGRQVGFSRTVTDGHVHAYLADVYVVPELRGRGLGIELVGFSVDESPFAGYRWVLHTADAHDLYRRFGFARPSDRMMERGRS